MKCTAAVLLVLAIALAASSCSEDSSPPPAPGGPAIDAVSPSESPTAGNVSVTVSGAGFEVSGTTSVTFGSTPATDVKVVNSCTISCVVPAHAAGTVDVTVANPDGKTCLLAAGFNYAADPAVASASFALGAVDRSGSGFPSDMCVAMDPTMSRTLFVTDEATVDAAAGARVIPVNMDLVLPGPDTLYATFTIHKTDLLQSGGSAVLAGDTWGSWSLQATTDDLLVVHAGLGFLLISASCESDSPYLANLAVFKPQDGSLLQVLNLAIQHSPAPGSLRSDGSAIAASFIQTNPSGLAYVPGTGTQGRLYVSMSNLYDSSSFPQTMIYNPGTVMVFDVDTSLATPVTATPSSTLTPSRWNPVQVTRYFSTQAGRDYVLISEAGVNGYYGTSASFGYSPPYQLVSHTDAAVEIIDASVPQIISWDPGSGARTNIDLGLAAPSLDDIAITVDAAGHTAGLLGSSFYGRIYAVDLTGLNQFPVDAAGLKPLRNAYNPVQVFSYCGSDHDYAGSVSVAPGGKYALVTDFNGAKAHVVSLPANFATGEFRSHPAYYETPLSFTALDTGLPRIGKAIFRTGSFSGPEAWLLVSNVEPNFMSPTNLKFGAVATVDFHGRVK